jgi:hypothetical protein
MAHNGGRSQLNLWFFGLDHSYIFINHLKTGTRWDATTVAQYAPTHYTDRGYPKVSAGQVTSSSIWIPNQTDRPGRWVVRWTGAGSFTLVGSHTVNSGSTSGTNGRYEWTPTISVNATNDLTYSFRITASSDAAPITNVEIYHIDDEALLDAGEVFNTRFLDQLREANFGSIRFLDWIYANTSLLAHWEDRKSVDYYSYQADELKASIFAGTTTNSGTDYSLSYPGFVLEDKARLILLFNANGTASVTHTLDVEGTGAKPILGRGGGAATGSTVVPKADRYTYLIYDAELDGWLKDLGDSTGAQHGFLRNYVPFELMVRLCNEVGADPWFNIPFMALTPMTDLTSELITYLQANLDPALTPIFEPGNEIWNPGLGFDGTGYANNVALSRWGLSNDFPNWYGMALSLMGEAVYNGYGGDTTKYKVVCGVQTYGGTSTPRMESTRWVAEGGGRTPASDWVTHGACAGYWNFSSGQASASPYSSREMQCAYDYSLAPSAAITTDLIMTRLSNNERFTPTNVKTRWTLYKAYFDVYGVPMIQYEGGYSPDYLTFAVTRVVNAATQANPCVVTLNSNGTFELPPVGASITFPTISAGMTQLSGNTYTVLGSSGTYNTAGNTITIDVDSSAFGAWSGTATITYTNMQTMINAVRAASKRATEIYDLEMAMYNDFADYNGSAPSMYMFCGSNQAWSTFDPNGWSDPTQRWQVAIDYNAVTTSEPEPTFTLPRGGGSNRNKKKERRYVLEMDDKMYQVSSLEEARAILQSQPKPQKKNKTLKLPKLTIELGEVSRVKVKNVPLVKALTMNVPLDLIEDAIQRIEDDEEEALLLLLH